MTILLAEDNRALGDTLVRALTVEGHTVHWVHDGIQALDCLTQNTYDCWVTECVLPRMNADAVAACAAKQGVSVPSVGILGTSYYTDDTAALDVLLPKPFDLATLLLAIRRATEANGQEVYADVTLDLDAKELRYRGRVTQLTVAVEDCVEIHGDRGQLADLVDIALSNALQYSRSYAELTLNRRGERVMLVIRNDVDVPLEDGPMDSVFERFWRDEGVVAQGAAGVGIDLSVAKEIVKRHGGRIMAEVQDGVFVLKVEL